MQCRNHRTDIFYPCKKTAIILNILIQCHVSFCRARDYCVRENKKKKVITLIIFVIFHMSFCRARDYCARGISLVKDSESARGGVKRGQRASSLRDQPRVGCTREPSSWRFDTKICIIPGLSGVYIREQFVAHRSVFPLY